MENTKEIIATLKAEVITEVTFIEPRNYEKLKGNLYEKDFEANIGVKVGNSIDTLTLEIVRDYVSTTGDYGTPTYVESHYLPHAPKIVNNKFDNLIEAGIEIDFSEVLHTYQKEVWKARDIQKAHTASLKKARKNARSIEFPTTWPHEFVKIVNADRNKNIVAANFTLTPSGKSHYINGGDLFININYKNVVGRITHIDGGYQWRDAVSVGKNEKGYRESFQISDGKTRKAKREGTSLLKFLQAVDEYFTIREARKTRATNEAEKREEKRVYLEKISGYPVIILSERKYQKDHRGYTRRESYLVHTYKIITGQPRTSYSEPKGFLISNSIEYDTKVETFSIRTLGNLNEKQFKIILDTLLEGKETFSKVVYPKK